MDGPLHVRGLRIRLGFEEYPVIRSALGRTILTAGRCYDYERQRRTLVGISGYRRYGQLPRVLRRQGQAEFGGSRCTAVGDLQPGAGAAADDVEILFERREIGLRARLAFVGESELVRTSASALGVAPAQSRRR